MNGTQAVVGGGGRQSLCNVAHRGQWSRRSPALGALTNPYFFPPAHRTQVISIVGVAMLVYILVRRRSKRSSHRIYNVSGQ